MEIILTWSSDTYVPSDYIGKALPAKGSVVEIAANVFSQNVCPRELVYNWFLDGRMQKNESGKGKQVFKFNIGESSAKKSVKVAIKNQEGFVIGESPSLNLKSWKTEIVFGTNAFLSECLGSVLGYQIYSNEKIVFTAWPYFFDIKSVDELNYQWALGGKDAVQTDKENPNVLTVEIGQLISSFTQELTVEAENKNNPLQRTKLTAEINFIP